MAAPGSVLSDRLSGTAPPAALVPDQRNAVPGAGDDAGRLLAAFPSPQIGKATLKGAYHANEDRIGVWEDLRATWDDVALPHRLSMVLLCDGHDGAQCAQFIQAHFASRLHDAVKAAVPAAGGAAEAVDWQAVLRATFQAVEAQWTDHVRRMRLARGHAPANGVTSGACCTCVLLYGGEVVAANVGDARAVLRRADASVEVLTGDHRCNNEGERARILGLGGFIRNNRVLGVLEPTRTIGDLEEKEKTQPGVISAVPDTDRTLLRPGDVPTAAELATALASLHPQRNGHGPARARAGRGDGAVFAGVRHRAPALTTPFTLGEATATAAALPTSVLVVASDGVWDVLTSTAASAVVVHALAVHGDATAAALELVRMALKHGSTDDITAAVVWLRADAPAAAARAPVADTAASSAVQSGRAPAAAAYACAPASKRAHTARTLA